MRYIWLACVLCIVGCGVQAADSPKDDVPTLTEIKSKEELKGKTFIFEGDGSPLHHNGQDKKTNRWIFPITCRYTVPATKFKPAHEATSILNVQFTDEAEETAWLDKLKKYEEERKAVILLVSKPIPKGTIVKQAVPPKIKLMCKGMYDYAEVKRID